MNEPARPPHGWRALGAVVRGAAHVKRDQPCQDSLQWKVRPDGILIAATADGAGSAKLAEIGSAKASDAAIQSLAAAAYDSGEARENAMRAALRSAREAVVREATERKSELRDLATTLLVSAVSANWAIAAQIGDGAVLCGSDTLRALTRPVSSEYLNETQFLTSETALADAQVNAFDGGIEQVALFTDGLQLLALKMPEGSPHGAFFNPLFGFVKEAGDMDSARHELAAFLSSPRITSRTDDDLTLFLAVRG